MAEYNKKRCRKSKLVPRECGDGFEINSSDVQAPLQVMLKEMNPESVKTPEKPPPIQFSINVEVEECSEDFIMEVEDSSEPEMCSSRNPPLDESSFTMLQVDPPPGTSKTSLDLEMCDSQAPLDLDFKTFPIHPSRGISKVVTTMQQCLIGEDVLRKQTEDLMETTTSLADKILEIEIRNKWGSKMLPLVKTAQEYKLHLAIDQWGFWNKQSKFRDTVYCYKCYCCNLAWWHLTPFREHLKLHDNIEVTLETVTNLGSIIAYDNSSGLFFRHIPVEGDCWRCLKSFQEHLKLTPSKLFYCEACLERFPNCSALAEHEGKCLRYQKIHYKDVVRSDNDWKCHYCKTFCVTQDRYHTHLAVRHSVRSDVPIAISMLKSCMFCQFKYVNNSSHHCPVKPCNFQCLYCCRQFQCQKFVTQHEDLTQTGYNCPICDKFLKKRCMEMEHMVIHSENYILAYRCTICVENILFPDENSVQQHQWSWHRSLKAHKRRLCYETIVIPKSSMTCTNVEKLDIVTTVHGKFTLPNHSGDAPVTKLKPIRATTNHAVGKSTKHSKQMQRALEIMEIEKEIEIKDDLLNKLIQRTFQHKLLVGEVKTERDLDATNDNVHHASGLKCSNEIKTDLNRVNNAAQLPIDETPEESNLNEVNEPLTDDVANETRKIELNETLSDEVSKEYEGNTVSKLLNVESPRNCSKNEESKHLNEHATSNNEIGKSEFDYIVVKTEVEAIKTENDGFGDFYEIVEELTENLEIKKELGVEETLSNIFRPSKHVTGTTMSARSIMADKIVFKQEPVEEEEEEFVGDIIILNPRQAEKPPNYEDSVTFEIQMAESNNSESSSLGHSSEMDVSNFESEVTMHDGNLPRRYRCCRCGFEGFHRQFKKHVQYSCPRNTYTKSKKNQRFRNPVPFPRVAKELWDSYVCTKCDQKFSTMKKYLLHFSEHNLLFAQCPACRAELIHLDKAIRHVISHVKRSFMKIKLIKQTTEVSSKIDGLFQCRTCAENFVYEDFFAHWESHLKLRETPKVTVKEEAEESTEVTIAAMNSEDLLAPEMLKKVLDALIYNPPRTGPQACIVCTRAFHRRNDCKRHLIEHLLRDAFANKHIHHALRCQECEQVFYKCDKYKQHMRLHASLPLYKCEICNRAFSDSSNFTKHKKVHNLQVLVCDICGTKFQAKSSIERHMEMHRVTAPMPCDRCDKVFFYRSHLTKHVSVTHERSVSRYPCIICKYTFKSLKDKWDHMWQVHKERKFKADCPFCKKSYRKYQEVKQHITLYHNIRLDNKNLRALI